MEASLWGATVGPLVYVVEATVVSHKCEHLVAQGWRSYGGSPRFWDGPARTAFGATPGGPCSIHCRGWLVQTWMRAGSEGSSPWWNVVQKAFRVLLDHPVEVVDVTMKNRIPGDVLGAKRLPHVELREEGDLRRHGLLRGWCRWQMR